MGGDATELKGPDLTQGVAVADVPDGGMLLGHAAGEAAILVRHGAEVRALGATCTHYGGPLAEGIVVGDTVRCPWHHACFDLKTGEAVRAPALNPVPCFHVDVRDGRAAVTGREEPAKTAPAPGRQARTPLADPGRVVILGAGAAGNAAAETLRREGHRGPITLVGAEASVPYDRPNLSKDYLAGHAPEEWIPLHPREFYAEREIALELGSPAVELDAGARQIRLASGKSLAYDALLFAPGAEPIRLAVPGAELEHVRTLRSLADSRAIIARAGTARRAVVVGASFIGLEAAAALRARGIEVHVVAPEAVPLARILGAEAGAFVRALHEEHGAVFHLGDTVSAIDPEAVTLASGARLAADLVVAGIGVRPAVALAEKAGLRVERGVVVDERLRASVPGIWAAGDVASYPDRRTGERVRIEHWVVAGRQGQAAARSMLGHEAPYDDVPFFWSAHHDLVIAYVGHATSWDRIDRAGSLADRSCVLAYVRGGRTLAVATIGRDRESLLAEAALERGDEDALSALVR